MVEGFFEGVRRALRAVFGDPLQTVLCAIKKWWCWVFLWLSDTVIGYLREFAAELPADLKEPIGDVVQFLTALDNWLPIHEGAMLLAGFYGFLAFYVLIKIVRRAIPTMG